MPLRDDLLNPIPGDNPSGVYLRRDTKLLLYDKIEEARRQDLDLPVGDWQHERKLADFPQALKLAQEALATKSKDLKLAAWLTEALLYTDNFAGLRQGLELCIGLINNFWDTLYPPIEDDGDLEMRAGPLEFLGTQLDVPLKSRPLAKAGYDWFKYKESRAVGFEDQVKNDKERKARQQKIDEDKKLAPEVFDKAFAETPKAFYFQSEKDLDACLLALKSLDELCDEKFGKDGPALSRLKTSLEEVRQVVHTLLEKKRETEPDPVEVAPVDDEGSGATGTEAAAGSAVSRAPGITFSVLTSSEPADRREAIATVARVAALLRQQDPHSPAPYLMMRGLRWGELRGGQGINDARLLEAPPTELRQHIKRLALAKKWNELLEDAENAMSLPCSRAWLDLQRLVVGACTALGEEYEPIAAAIRSELKALLNDMPQLLDAALLDDTPTANAETRAWLQQLGTQPASTEGQPAEAAAQSSNGHGAGQSSVHGAPSWLQKSADAYALAQDTLRGGQPEKAFEIMRKEIARQRSGRGRFERTLQLVELCVSAGKDAIAQPLLDDLAEAIETHKLDDWEDKEMVAAALATIMRVSKRVQDDESEKKKLFERICRLDPVRALSAG